MFTNMFSGENMYVYMFCTVIINTIYHVRIAAKRRHLVHDGYAIPSFANGARADGDQR